MKKNYLRFLALVFSVLSFNLAHSQCTSSVSYPSNTICQGTYYVFGSDTLTVAGTYNDTFVLAGGCDSIISLQLAVIPYEYTYLYDSMCPGGSYVFNSQTLTSPGVYTDTLYSQVTFCDSIIILNLAIDSVSHNDTFWETVTYCMTGGFFGGGGGYNFHGSYLTSSGTYVYDGGPLPSGGNCADSVVVLYLTVGAAPIRIGGGGFGPGGGPDTIATCSASYNFYGRTLTTDGNYSDSVISSLGCDSIIAFIYLKLNSGYNSAQVQGSSCGGAPFVWRGNSYPVSGIGFGGTVYYDTVPGPGGCDTIYKITVRNGIPGPTVQMTDSFCAGTAFTYDDSVFTAPGTYTITGGAAQGQCDSTIYLTLTYKTAPTYTLIDSFCDGSSYTYRGHTYTDSGLHIFTEPNPAGGCDSIIQVYLRYKSAPVINIQGSFCQGMTYTYRGVVYDSAALYSFTVTAPSGCDSIFNLNLSYTTPPTATIVDSFCRGSAYVYDGNTYTARGTYQIMSSHPGMCDSAITLILTYKVAPRITVTDSFCQGSLYVYGDSTFTAPGSYRFLTPASAGCDTIVTLNLTYKVAPVAPVISLQPGNILIVNPAASSYQWYLNGNAIPGAVGQSYLMTQSGVYYVTLNDTLGMCPGTSANDTITGVGINEVSASGMFKLYPNPNTGQFTIEAATYIGADITIYDVLGRAIYQKQLSTAKQNVDLGDVTDGTYYLVMKNQKAATYAHFVIAR